MTLEAFKAIGEVESVIAAFCIQVGENMHRLWLFARASMCKTVVHCTHVA